MNGVPTAVQVRRGWLRRQAAEQQRERLPSTPLELPHPMIEIGGRHAHLPRRGRICNANGGVTPRRGSPNESAMNRQIIRSGFTPSMPASISM